MSSRPAVDYGRMLHLLEMEGQLLTTATLDVHPDSLAAGVSRSTAQETVERTGDLCDEALSWLGSSSTVAHNREPSSCASMHEASNRFANRLGELLAELRARPSDDPCPTWWPADQTARFWLRRMLHAATVSRVDVQTAARVEVTPVDSGVALDGIDELLRVWLDYRLNDLGISASNSCSVKVYAADCRWHVQATPHHVAVTQRCDVDDESQEDAVVGGEPADVYLWLWGRLPDRAVKSRGDHDAVAQMWGLLRLATQ